MQNCHPIIESAKLISASLLRLRMKSPFFGTLAMFVQFIPSSNIATAATDGRAIFFNPEFLQTLPRAQQDGLLLHEILHAALLHPLRLRERDARLWNIAADIVVNGMIIRQGGFELPLDGLRDETLEHLSVEEVYELLQTTGANRFPLANLDLLPATTGDVLKCATSGTSHKPPETHSASLKDHSRETLTAHWQQALQQATAVSNGSKAGKLAVGLDRDLESIVNPQLDWRSYLWRYLVQTPTDFQGFDRRFVGRGLYLESLQGESVRVYIAVDTSGSVGARMLALFLNEVRGILGSYPSIICDLYYVDTEAYGPHPLTFDPILPIPQGGGGSSFVAFFDRVAAVWDGYTQAVCIYLTDGYGEFPTTIPPLPTLWVVTPGGLDLAQFPFGEAVRSIEGN
jgi:predicted metal-dependent peptidase